MRDVSITVDVDPEDVLEALSTEQIKKYLHGRGVNVGSHSKVGRIFDAIYDAIGVDATLYELIEELRSEIGLTITPREAIVAQKYARYKSGNEVRGALS